jgi:hypothetical protein
MEIQSLVVKQQISLIKTSRTFQEFEQSRPMTPPMEITTSLGTTSLVMFEGHCPHPQSLVPYQEKSLAESQFSFTTDIESMAQIHSVSDKHVNNLLRRWTCLSLTEKDLSIISTPSTSKQNDSVRRLSQQATVESDDEGNEDPPKLRSPAPRNGGNLEPLLDYADPGLRETTSPIAVPGVVRRRSSASIPETFSNWGYSSLPNTSFPHRPYHATGLSPTSPQSPSLTRSISMPSSPIQNFPSGPGSITSTHSSHTDPEDHLGIPYRLRLHNSWWEFLDEELVHSNTNLAHTIALNDHHTVTEIRECWIDADALRERHLPFGMITRSVGDNRKTKLRSFYCVERPLRFRDVTELVERSSVLVEEKKRAHAAKRDRRRSSTTSRRGKPSTDLQLPRSPKSSTTSFTPQWAPTEEERLEEAEYYERSRKGKERARRASSFGPRDAQQGRGGLGVAEKEGDRRALSTGRRRDRADKESPEREQERGSSKSGRRRSTLRTMAEGAGLATIVTSLAEMADML